MPRVNRVLSLEDLLFGSNNLPSSNPSATDDPDPPSPLEPSPEQVPPSRARSSTSAQLVSAHPQLPAHITPLPNINSLRRRLQPGNSRNRAVPTASPRLPQLEEVREGAHDSYSPGRANSRSPSRKRRRLHTMRPDSLSSANGFSPVPNGSTQRKAGLNGQSASANGDAHANGSGKALASSTYYGHNREEVTRILIQSLYELGYSGSASALSAESGYQLETAGVATFRNAVLDGRWADAEQILVRSFKEGNSQNGQKATPERTLVLAEGADRSEMLFYLRQQKFLELLENRDLAAALLVLRQELTPLGYDVDRLHALTSLLMCPADQLHEQAGWEGPISSSRERLLADLSRSISPSVMIPQHRLAILLDYVKQDHHCDRSDFPLEVSVNLTEHTDEVWYCGFSHDGSKLVTAGSDRMVLIYDTTDFTVIHRLMDHDSGVAFVSWSPDDTKLITCSQDKKARLWNVETGHRLLTIDHHSQPVTAAGWAPDGESFVTSSFDHQSQICHWSIRGSSIHMWKSNFRVQDCAISPDGRRLVAADTEAKIHVFDFRTYEEDYCLSLDSNPTSVTISRDSKYMLVSLKGATHGEIQLIDLDTTAVVRTFKGHKQGEYVLRSTFGGANENFVVSGSDDSKVYIWHKENTELVEALEGHTKGCVNFVSWNPADPTMFASAGDDRVVRIWSRERDRSRFAVGPSRSSRGVSSNGFPLTSALRTTSAF
ncbi:hypothetical protein N7470_006381 [Penicillium chermesinum]|nr:hypothetical protein N7470_006381 [Penicillium chermesinum]